MVNTAASKDKILEVKDLRISFRTDGGTVKAVRGISFSLFRGRTLAIVGESGSGKSVTSKAILGILANNKIIEDGQIIYDGKDLLHLSEESFSKIRGVKISMIFQDPLSSLNPIMIVGKQLTEAMVLKHRSEVKEARKSLKRLDSILAKVDKTKTKDLEKSLKDSPDGSLDLTAYHDLFAHGVSYAFQKRKEAVTKVLAELETFKAKHTANERVDFRAAEKELKHLYPALSETNFALAEEPDNILSVFPAIVHDIVLSAKESADLQKKQEKDLEKNHVTSFFDLPPALRARSREVLIPLSEHKRHLKDAVSELESRLTFLSQLDEKDVEKTLIADVEAYYSRSAKSVKSRLTSEEAKERAIKMLGEVGIAEPERRYKQYPFELSGGMRQRIVIAIALCSNPEILICDEPTTALDVTIQSQILELINKVKKEKNLSIVFITHDLGVVANMADDIAVMYAGKIVEYGTSTDIFYDPRHPYTWALLGSVPDLKTKEKLNAIPGTPPNMLLPPKGDAFALRNKDALKIDSLLQPPFFEISPTHYAATWNIHEDAPEIRAPEVVVARIRNALADHPEYTPKPVNTKNSILNYLKEAPHERG
jgi:oligopeptide transport system ATP-binding protein